MPYLIVNRDIPYELIEDSSILFQDDKRLLQVGELEIGRLDAVIHIGLPYLHPDLFCIGLAFREFPTEPEFAWIGQSWDAPMPM
jgi:hypothetical protein